MDGKTSGGLGFGGFMLLLGLLFIALKLMHYIDWAWMLVLAPIWLVIAVGVLGFAFAVLVGTVIKLLTD